MTAGYTSQTCQFISGNRVIFTIHYYYTQTAFCSLFIHVCEHWRLNEVTPQEPCRRDMSAPLCCRARCCGLTYIEALFYFFYIRGLSRLFRIMAHQVFLLHDTCGEFTVRLNMAACCRFVSVCLGARTRFLFPVCQESEC